MAKDTTTKTRAAGAKKTRTAAAAKPTARRTLRRRAAAPAPVAVTHEQIALRAYELHLAGSEGDAMAHWLRAERELATA